MRRLIYILLTILTAMLNCSAMDVTFSGATPQFHYYNQDHLGNNREVISESGVLEQVTHYYPFGGPFCERTTAGANTNATLQRYKYNGKELDLMHGLKWYDYGARMYDPILLTWNAIDPLCEEYYGISPYVYCKDNPIKYLDPNGLDGLISIYGNNIKISANIYLYGTGATKYVLQQMQNDVDKVWGKDHSIEHEGTTYNVSFDINMALYGGKEKNNPMIIADSWNPFSRNNYIDITEDCKRAYVLGGDEGQWRCTGRNGTPLARDDSAPHEVGHILGLPDQYTDKDGPNKGWENNIMGDSKNGKLDNRNINDILKDVWKEYSKWLNEGNKGIFRYEINP